VFAECLLRLCDGVPTTRVHGYSTHWMKLRVHTHITVCCWIAGAEQASDLLTAIIQHFNTAVCLLYRVFHLKPARLHGEIRKAGRFQVERPVCYGATCVTVGNRQAKISSCVRVSRCVRHTARGIPDVLFHNFESYDTFLGSFIEFSFVLLIKRGRSWLRHCATNRKVAGSIPGGVIGILHWHNPSARTVALRSTQPLTEMSTRNTSWGVKAAGA
jgi:hypothetical protein